MIKFPKLYLKTPTIEEKVALEDGVYLVNSKVEVCVYQKSENNYCGIITKDIIFADGYIETNLLKYFSNVDRYDDLLEMIDDYLEELK